MTQASDYKGNSCYRFTNSGVRLALLVLVYIGYVCLGAGIFSIMESPHEREIVERVRHQKHKFLNDNNCLTDDELESFIVEIVRANDFGVSAVRNATNEPNWSFGQAFFFAATVLTTIGYGHVTPLSEGGKVFCILYALLGIPLTLILLTALVERLMLPTTALLDWMQARLGHLYAALPVKLLHLAVIVLIVLVLVFLVPAAAFSYLESGWNYVDAIYYCFISVTTIGLGDYIPGDNPAQPNRALYKILTTLYLFIGLVLMMLMLAHIHRIPELNVGFHFYMMSDHQGSDEERTTLRPAGKVPAYTRQIDEADSPEAYQAAPEADQRQLTK